MSMVENLILQTPPHVRRSRMKLAMAVSSSRLLACHKDLFSLGYIPYMGPIDQRGGVVVCAYCPSNLHISQRHI